MTLPPAYRSREEFLAAPLEEARSLMPSTVICALSGTRRAAALAGVAPQGQEYAHWSHAQMFRCIELLFRYNVQHLFLLLLGPSQFNETTGQYQEHLWEWFEWGVAGPEALAIYERNHWRVRVAFSPFIPRLRQCGEAVRQATSWPGEHTLWCCAIPDEQQPLNWLLEAVHQSQARSRAEALRALYGEEFPPAAIYLGSGKPLLSSFQLPPLLIEGEMQCYWNQRPGYSLDEQQLRLLLYDYAYLRQTWQADKTGRAEQAVKDRETWERAPILGMGTRLGPFWYPDDLKR